MCSPIAAITVLTTSPSNSSRFSKWYEIKPVLDRPARFAIRAYEALAIPISAMVVIAASTICARRAVSINDRGAGAVVERIADMSKK